MRICKLLFSFQFFTVYDIQPQICYELYLKKLYENSYCLHKLC